MRHISAIIFLGFALLSACAQLPKPGTSAFEAATRRCKAYAMEQLGMRGTPLDIYVTEVKADRRHITVDVSPPAMSSDGYIYFGGGGTFVCDARGKVISETYDR